MNKLTIPMCHILFHDGSEKQITEKQAEILLNEMDNKETENIRIGKSSMKKSAVSKILSSQEYYEQYPEKRLNIPEFSEYYDEPFDWKKVTKTGFLKELIRGLKKFIGEQKEDTPYADSILKEMENRLSTCA